MNNGFVEVERMLGFPEEIRMMITWLRRLNEARIVRANAYQCHVFGWVAFSPIEGLFTHHWEWDDNEWQFWKRTSKYDHKTVHRGIIVCGSFD